MKQNPITHGLKSKKGIRNPKIALKEFHYAFSSVKEAERGLWEDRQLLGDACKELREAHNLTQAELSMEGALSLVLIKEIEKSASSDLAARYWQTIKSIKPSSPASPRSPSAH